MSTTRKSNQKSPNVNHNNKTLLFVSEPNYLGVISDRSLTYRRHLESLRKNSPHWLCHQRRLANCDWMLASCNSGQPLHSRRHPTCWSSSQRNYTVSSTLFYGAWTHLPHSALTCPPGANVRRLKSRHSFVLAAQQLISSSDNNNIRAVHWTDHQWNTEWLDSFTRLRTFIPDTGTHPLGMTSQEQRGSGLTASTPVSDVSSPACTNGVWPPLQPVSVAQKNKPSTMSSSNIQSIDLLMDCTAWRFWSMRQSNSCPTPARDLMRPSRGQKQLAQATTKKM